MMYAWSFAARMVDEVARLLRSMGKHRYVKEVDLRIHWSVDVALCDLPEFRAANERFEALKKRRGDLDLASRDPDLWRPATVEEIIAVLTAFWGPEDEADHRRERLLEALADAGCAELTHDPFDAPVEEPPHPELLLLDWLLLPVDELDSERHRGALVAMEDSGDEVDPSAPIYQEAPPISAPELCFGARQGILEDDFVLWSEPPYTYADYVFRGVTKSAKLVDPPVGYRDE